MDRTLGELNDANMDCVLDAFPLEIPLHRVARVVAKVKAFVDASLLVAMFQAVTDEMKVAEMKLLNALVVVAIAVVTVTTVIEIAVVFVLMGVEVVFVVFAVGVLFVEMLAVAVEIATVAVVHTFSLMDYYSS